MQKSRSLPDQADIEHPLHGTMLGSKYSGSQIPWIAV